MTKDGIPTGAPTYPTAGTSASRASRGSFRSRRLTFSNQEMGGAAAMVQQEFEEDANTSTNPEKGGGTTNMDHSQPLKPGSTLGVDVGVGKEATNTTNSTNTHADQDQDPSDANLSSNNSASSSRSSFRSRRLTFSKQEMGIASGAVAAMKDFQLSDDDEEEADGGNRDGNLNIPPPIPSQPHMNHNHHHNNNDAAVAATAAPEPPHARRASRRQSKRNSVGRRFTYEKEQMSMATAAVAAMKDIDLSDDEDNNHNPTLGNVAKRPSVSSLSECSLGGAMPPSNNDTNFRSRRLTFSKQEMGSAAAAIAVMKDVDLSDDEEEDGGVGVGVGVGVGLQVDQNRNESLPPSMMVGGAPHQDNGPMRRAARRSSTTSDATAVTSDESDSTKGEDFRRRRLTCSKQQMGSAAAAIAALKDEDLGLSDDDNDKGASMKPAATITTQKMDTETSIPGVPSHSMNNNVQADPNFRSRRLTCSKMEMGAAAATVMNDMQLSDDDDAQIPTNDMTKKAHAQAQPSSFKKRKPSVPESHVSSKPPAAQMQNVSWNASDRPPMNISMHNRSPNDADSEATTNDNAQFPFSSRKKQKREDTDTSSEKALPREKVSPVNQKGHDSNQDRMGGQVLEKANTPKSKDKSKLPYSRNVVGTFSCHGIEPCHDSGSLRKRGNTAVAKINQDRGGVSIPYANSPRTALFAVYDGHGRGGELVSQHALHEIPRRLEQAAEFKMGDYARAFQRVFVDVDQDLIVQDDIDPRYSGCTACVILMLNKLLYIANVGDSRAVMGQRTQIQQRQLLPEGYITSQSKPTTAMRALDLSVDQNPDSPGEKERIERSGGFVSPPAEEGLSSRVWLDHGCTQIGLAMSRSIGDHVVNDVGVIAEPVVTKYELKEEDSFLVIATDGVWEFLSSQEVVDMVNHDLRQGLGSSEACQNLIKAAAAKWHEYEGDYRDDITALVVRVKELWN